MQNKKDALAKSQRFQPLTNCSLYLNKELYNLNVIDKEAIAYLVGHLSAAKEGAKSLVPNGDFKISGFPVSEWITDLKSKYSILDRKIEETRLKNLEKELHDLLTTDTKVDLRLTELESQI